MARAFQRRRIAPSATIGDACVVGFGAGIALYFALPAEPALALCVLAITVAGVFASRGSLLALAALCLALGTGRAAWHTHAAAHTVLPPAAAYHTVTGWIADVERGASGLRWIVEVDTLSNVDAPPPRIRVNVGDTASAAAGQGVRFRARLYAPPGPAVPGGYDSRRAAWFRGIGAYGRLVSDVDPHTVPWTPRRHIAHWRHGVAARIHANSPPATAGLQVALVTGVRHHMPSDQIDTLRDAGLAHLIAISGLHMAVFAGYAYAGLAWVFAGLSMGRARDARKLAALVALGVATFYLVLSGASVSTQRAYVMIGTMLLAVVLERRPFSLRSVSVAALLTLAIHPEAILSAGFHMSFAAVAALIVVFGWWNVRRERFPTGPVRRAANAMGSLAATSAIAGLATAGFAVLHFGRLARYGLAANLAAMPIFTFVTMPAAMLALLALPLGLEGAPLWLMGRSLAAVLLIADTVAGWPGAVAIWPGARPFAVVVFAAGLILLLLGRDRVRVAGLAALMAVPLTAYRAPVADVRISDRGVVTVITDGGIITGGGVTTDDGVVSSRPRADRFGRDIWLESMGQSAKPVSMACDPLGCSAPGILVLPDTVDLAAACADARLVVVDARVSDLARRGCAALVIDRTRLVRDGALHITLGHTLRITPSRRGNRPWTPKPLTPR